MDQVDLLFKLLKENDDFKSVLNEGKDLADIKKTKAGLLYLLKNSITHLKFYSPASKKIYSRVCTNSKLIIAASNIFKKLFHHYKIHDIDIDIEADKNSTSDKLKTFDVIKGNYITVTLDDWRVVKGNVIPLNPSTIEKMYRAAKELH